MFMKVQNVVIALVKPKGITNHSKVLYQVTQRHPFYNLNLVVILVKIHPVKYLACPSQSNKSEKSGIWYLFLKMTLLSA